MANIAFKKIKNTNDYVDLAQELDITLIEGHKYQLEVQNSVIMINYPTKPTIGGFSFSNRQFGYTHTGGTLWVKVVGYDSATINIAEG